MSRADVQAGVDKHFFGKTFQVFELIIAKVTGEGIPITRDFAAQLLVA